MDKNTNENFTCKSCGAQIEAGFAYCPYCGSINIIGAEKEYFKDLEKVQDNLAQMGDDSKEEFKDTVKTGSKYVVKIAIIIAGIVLALALIVLIINHIEEKIISQSSDYSYEEKEYPELDAFYDAGDYDGLIDYMSENSEELGDGVYSWDHFWFATGYKYTKWFANDTETAEIEAAAGEISKDTQNWVIYDGLLVLEYYEDNLNTFQLTDEEKQIIEPCAQSVPDTIKGIFKMTDEEYSAMHDYFLSEDRYERDVYVSLDLIKKYLKKNKLYIKY